MLITRQNIGRLKEGQKVWQAGSGFTMVKRIFYLGIFDFEGQQKHLFCNPNQDIITMAVNPNIKNDHIVKHSLCTEREEACELMRERSVKLLDHFNKHEFKNNPIIYETV